MLILAELCQGPPDGLPHPPGTQGREVKTAAAELVKDVGTKCCSHELLHDINLERVCCVEVQGKPQVPDYMAVVAPAAESLNQSLIALRKVGVLHGDAHVAEAEEQAGHGHVDRMAAGRPPQQEHQQQQPPRPEHQVERQPRAGPVQQPVLHGGPALDGVDQEQGYQGRQRFVDVGRHERAHMETALVPSIHVVRVPQIRIGALARLAPVISGLLLGKHSEGLVNVHAAQIIDPSALCSVHLTSHQSSSGVVLLLRHAHTCCGGKRCLCSVRPMRRTT
mmetsp:Transcript_53946/g.167191  ORF Transcript_53946/g.167191 Transcript_53946/m.167191 type:complete len:278 (-) Transcript_53946:112-945(-)